MPRKATLTRDTVEAAWIHPAPAFSAQLPALDQALGQIPTMAPGILRSAISVVPDVRIQESVGTTLPTWRVLAPSNPEGPPVAWDQYRGDLVYSIGIFGADHGFRFSAIWTAGKLATVTLNGALMTLTALRAALKARIPA